MSPANTALLIGAQLVVIALPAVSLAWLLRRAGIPGGRTAAAILAGVLVSLLAGPSVLGRSRPALSARIVQGGHSEHEQITELVSRQRAESAALLESGVSSQALAETKVRHAEQRTPLIEGLRVARADHQRRLGWLALSFAALHALFVMPIAIPRTRAAFRRSTAALVSDKLLGVRLGITIAVFAAAAPVAVGLVMGYPPAGAIALGIVFGVGGLSAALTGRAFAAGAVALLVALCALVPAAYSLHLFVLGAALLISMLLATGLPASLVRRWRMHLYRTATAAFFPACIALALAHVDYHILAQSYEFWIVLVLSALWSSDGRWFASALAARIVCREGAPHRENPWQLATRLIDAGAATSQVVIALALTASGTLPAYAFPAAVAGAAIIELTRGARDWITRVIEFQKKLEDEAESRGL